MFVYNRGKLVESRVDVSPTEFVYKLTHITSGMNIEVYVDADAQNSDKPYKVYREVDGNYTDYKEFHRKQKTIKENFEEAIAYFEENIYKAMKETPPVDDSKRPDIKDKPETFKEIPIVGDIVQIGNVFGIVTDVDGTEVTVKEMSKKEAMDILRNQKNAGMATSIDDVEMAFGGVLKFAGGSEVKNNSIFKKFDSETDNIIIFRIKPQENATPPDEQEPTDEQETNQPVPENIKDPFEEKDSKNKDKQDKNKQDKDKQDQDGESEDGEGQDGEGQDGEGQDGEGQDGEGQDGEGAEDGEGEDGEGQDGENENDEGEGNQGGNSEGDDFGDDDVNFPKKTLEEMLQEVQDAFEQSNSGTPDLTEDISILERTLSTPREQIKETFKTASLAKKAIGKLNIFGADNDKRLNETLNEIFK